MDAGVMLFERAHREVVACTHTHIHGVLHCEVGFGVWIMRAAEDVAGEEVSELML